MLFGIVLIGKIKTRLVQKYSIILTKQKESIIISTVVIIYLSMIKIINGKVILMKRQ